MIISRTPLRVSFAGGGSDFSTFYKSSPGAVISTSINKYVYLTINKKFDKKIRVSYSKTETVNTVNEIEHPLVREALKKTKIDGGIEITSVSDIPSQGTGLGSSSSFIVGLLNALYAYKGQHVTASRLAKEACDIEILRLKEPVGKQDQYIAAFGGLDFMQFNPDESVFVDPIICKTQTKKKLNDSLLMLYTGKVRAARSVLDEQKKNMQEAPKKEIVAKMVLLAAKLKDSLLKNDLNDFGNVLHENWILKKQLASSISNPQIDEWYDKAIKNGAAGGKILGAGGGGFLLLFAPRKNHPKIIRALKELTVTPFSLEPQGSKIIYVG